MLANAQMCAPERPRPELREAADSGPDFSYVPPAQFSGDVLAKIMPLLEKVVTDEHDATMESVVLDLFKGDTLLWVVNDYEAILVTRLLDRPRCRVLSIEWMAGENMVPWCREWAKRLDLIAQACSCAKIEFMASRPVERAISRLHPGFRKRYIVYEKDVP